MIPPKFHTDGRILDPDGKPLRRLYEKQKDKPDKLIPPRIENGKAVVWNAKNNVFQTPKEEYDALDEETQERILEDIEDEEDPEKIIKETEIS